MDYKAFFWDVYLWIEDVNRAVPHFGGMNNPAFWAWVAESSGKICAKYHNHRLVIKQMIMLVEWLEEVYDNQKTKGAEHA